jgi:integrase/recombinase XerD
MKNMQRSLLMFENAIKTEATRKTYLFHLQKFLDHYKIKDYDSLVKITNDKLQIMVEDYLFFLKQEVSPNSIPTIFAGIELFLSINDKVMNFKKIHKMYPPKIKKSGSKAWTTQDVQKVFQQARNRRSRALVLFIASTGCRIGALDGLERRHLVEMPGGCKAVAFYEGDNEEYWSFLTPEASASLDQYLKERNSDGENLNPKSPVFRSTYQIGSAKPEPLTAGAAKTLISRLVKNANLDRTKSGNRHDTQIAHAFRKRFATILKINGNISYSTTEALLGHKSGLDAPITDRRCELSSLMNSEKQYQT